MQVADVNTLKVVELRAALSTRGLDTSGVKAVLVARLTEHLQAMPPPKEVEDVQWLQYVF